MHGSFPPEEAHTHTKSIARAFFVGLVTVSAVSTKARTHTRTYSAQPARLRNKRVNVANPNLLLIAMRSLRPQLSATGARNSSSPSALVWSSPSLRVRSKSVQFSMCEWISEQQQWAIARAGGEWGCCGERSIAMRFGGRELGGLSGCDLRDRRKTPSIVWAWWMGIERWSELIISYCSSKLFSEHVFFFSSYSEGRKICCLNYWQICLARNN